MTKYMIRKRARKIPPQEMYGYKHAFYGPAQEEAIAEVSEDAGI